MKPSAGLEPGDPFLTMKVPRATGAHRCLLQPSVHRVFVNHGWATEGSETPLEREVTTRKLRAHLALRHPRRGIPHARATGSEDGVLGGDRSQRRLEEQCEKPLLELATDRPDLLP